MPKKNAVRIRVERPRDAAAVYEVNRMAFGRDDEARLVEKIRSTSGFIPELSLIALIGNQVVGHIVLSQIHVDSGKRSARTWPVLSLAPMAVRPGHQNQGIGSALVRQGLKRARRLGHKVVVVVGHPGYYPRFGFTPARPLGLEAPFPVPDEAFLALELVPGSLQGVRGKVVYPSVFEEVS
jgi:putative acetyltransferase